MNFMCENVYSYKQMDSNADSKAVAAFFKQLNLFFKMTVSSLLLTVSCDYGKLSSLMHKSVIGVLEIDQLHVKVTDVHRFKIN